LVRNSSFDATQSAGVLNLPTPVRPDYIAVHALAPNNKSTINPWADMYGGPMDLAPDTRKLDMSLGFP
jgi:hypothetical protein